MKIKWILAFSYAAACLCLFCGSLFLSLPVTPASVLGLAVFASLFVLCAFVLPRLARRSGRS